MIVDCPIPHTAPEGYDYYVEEFDSKYDRIMLHHHRKYDYNLGEKVATVWGFFNRKTKQYHSPINAKKVGKVVQHKTTPYTSMPLNQTPLEQAFQ
jgi:hypothetical protein